MFVPAGVAHTYTAGENARYLIVLTPRLSALIAALQADRDPSPSARDLQTVRFGTSRVASQQTRLRAHFAPEFMEDSLSRLRAYRRPLVQGWDLGTGRRHDTLKSVRRKLP